MWSIVAKDLREVTGSPAVLAPMVVGPLVVCAVIPGVLVALVLGLGPEVLNGVRIVERVVELYSIPSVMRDLDVQGLYVLLNYTLLPLFMVLPIMVSSVIGANSVVGEKERRTLETLLYTPVTNRELILAKLLGAFIPAVVVSAGGFLCYFLVANTISVALRGVLVVRSIIWLPTVLLLAPSVAMLGLSLTLLVSLRAKTYMEAQQLSAIVVIPFVALLYVQIAGVLTLRPLYVLIASPLFFLASYLIYGKIGPRFSREGILTTL